MGKTMTLSDKQKQAVELMVYQPERTLRSIAEEVGVHFNTITNWKKNKEFIDYKRQLALSVHGDYLVESLDILRKKALDGNTRSHVKYLELLLKTYGLLVERQEVSAVMKEEKSDAELLEELNMM
ncbi:MULTISPECIES: phBC6A51 family helix-turn-helix protein [Bacillus cereus group]|uniref:phBC6A51 family helix-turn-helix protein n=1 Tax=Bacillus cereus group TaxID=86661 RepID=UPI0020D25D86|nr:MULTISPECIES: phBC6A51 family helix-turn-helix protein [Bacillus cereus group]